MTWTSKMDRKDPSRNHRNPIRITDGAIQPAGRRRPAPATGGRKRHPHRNTARRTSRTRGINLAPALQEHPRYQEYPQQWRTALYATSAETQGTTKTTAQMTMNY